MNYCDIISAICIGVICILSFWYFKTEMSLKERAAALEKRVMRLETYEAQNKPAANIKQIPTELILDDLSRRIFAIEACRQCPLYLNTVREGIKQTIQSNKK